MIAFHFDFIQVNRKSAIDIEAIRSQLDLDKNDVNVSDADKASKENLEDPKTLKNIIKFKVGQFLNFILKSVPLNLDFCLVCRRLRLNFNFDLNFVY